MTFLGANKGICGLLSDLCMAITSEPIVVPHGSYLSIREKTKVIMEAQVYFTMRSPIGQQMIRELYVDQ